MPKELSRLALGTVALLLALHSAQGQERQTLTGVPPRVALQAPPEAVPADFLTPSSELEEAAIAPLDATSQADVRSVVAYLVAGETNLAMDRWADLTKRLVARDAASDSTALIQWVLRSAYIDADEGLKALAEKLQHMNGQKKQLRQELARLNRYQAALETSKKAGTRAPDAISVRIPTLDGTSSNGPRVRTLTAAGDTEKAILMATQAMQEMNMSFNLQYLQLQQSVQQENRQFTLLSNIMKAKHDTARAAINNIR